MTTMIVLDIVISKRISPFSDSGNTTLLNFTKDKTSHFSKLLQYLFTTLDYDVDCDHGNKVTSELLEGKLGSWFGIETVEELNLEEGDPPLKNQFLPTIFRCTEEEWKEFTSVKERHLDSEDFELNVILHICIKKSEEKDINMIICNYFYFEPRDKNKDYFFSDNKYRKIYNCVFTSIKEVNEKIKEVLIIE